MWGSRGPQLLAASPISNTGKRAVYYDWGRHNFLRGLVEFVKCAARHSSIHRVRLPRFQQAWFPLFAPHLKNNSQRVFAHVLLGLRNPQEDIFNEGARGSGDDAASDYEHGVRIRHR
jgi:hypothetical protein